MKNTVQNAGSQVDKAYAKLVSARSQTKRCKTMYLNAQRAEQDAQTEFNSAKEEAELALNSKS